MKIREWLLPQDKEFFNLLEAESGNVVTAAYKFEEAVKKFDNLEERRREIKDIEHHGDNIVHEIYERINLTFVTPIDREDITLLASLYDDVLDNVYGAINRIVLYEVKEATPPMVKFAELVRLSVDQIHKAFLSMRRIDKKEIDNRCIEVDRLENEADALLNDSVAELFRGEDVIKILKLKEIYERLEVVTDKCEDLSQELRDIVLKYS